MKKLLLAICLIALPLPALAANCVAVVFYDPTQSPTNNEDLIVQVAPWDGVQKFHRNSARFDAASVMIFYDQFGAQGGPTLDSGQEEYTLSFGEPIDGQPRSTLIQNNWNNAGSGNGSESASRGVFTAALNAGEDITLERNFAPLGLQRSYMNGQDIALIGVIDPDVFERADSLAGSIRSDIIANGCP